MGAAHISIDAIARRAGISKGGLLYHFPKKDALIQALVEQHLTHIEAMIGDAQRAAGSQGENAVAQAYIRIFRDNFCLQKRKPDGILIALAENPHLLNPVRAHQKRMAERIRASAADPTLSLITLLAAEGMKSLDLFEANPLTTEERAAVLDRLIQMLDEPKAGNPVEASRIALIGRVIGPSLTARAKAGPEARKRLAQAG